MDYDKKENASYLDGVPFTIGQRFCPPRPIPLPYCMSYQLPPDLISNEYEFALENKVLAFCQAKEEAEERLKEEERQKEETERRLQEEAASIPQSNGCDIKTSTSLWNPDTILQPQSQLPSTNGNGALVDGNEDLKKINLSDFEIDTRSPFDYMELQTINDWEELSTVFQDMGKDQKEDSAQLEQQTGIVSKSTSFPLVQKTNSAAFESGAANTEICSNGTSFFGYTLPTSKTISKNSGGYLSYSSPSVSAEEPLPHLESKRSSVCYGASGYSASDQVPCIISSTGQTATRNSLDFPSCNPLRSSKSIPDLSNIMSTNDECPYSRRSHTPPAKTPYCNLDDSVTYVKQPYDQNWNNNCSSNGSLPARRDLPDPYEELNNGERHFVDSITDMGFQRGQVSRTVKHLGTDEKKVVEHLCQIQVLEESGYDKFEAEAALHLHDYDKNEAVKYLDLINQFQDLGFGKEEIKKALVQHKNDRDKVIDSLLS